MNARPSNHPPRPRGRGGHSRGASSQNPSSSSSSHKPVPTTTLITPGTPVSIILKADQPTGHEVQGIVSELLTRGNHPRGIKVRLRDGRVGRVQRVVGVEEGERGEGGNGEGGEEGGVRTMDGARASGASGGFTGRRYGDFRREEPDEPKEAKLSLADYVVVKKGKKGKSKTTAPQDEVVEDEASEDVSATKTETTTCPVCGEFEGDEAAVAHHVNGHFD